MGEKKKHEISRDLKHKLQAGIFVIVHTYCLACISLLRISLLRRLPFSILSRVFDHYCVPFTQKEKEVNFGESKNTTQTKESRKNQTSKTDWKI